MIKTMIVAELFFLENDRAKIKQMLKNLFKIIQKYSPYFIIKFKLKCLPT